MIINNSDDYGIYQDQAERILRCHTDGCLNGVSIFVNTPQARLCAQMLSGKQIRCRLHLNLVEGPCTSDPSDVPALVDKEGKFCLSFSALFCRSLLSRKEMKRQLKTEIRSQIRLFYELLGEDLPFRVDSHRHYHMLPAVWNALFEVCREDGIEVDEIRISAESFGPILKSLGSLGTFPAMGFLKNIIMHILGAWNKQFGAQPDSFDFDKNVPVFLGITFSTKMFTDIVSRLLPPYRKIAEKQGRNLELMFHPGGLKPEDQLLDERFREFYLSSDRDEEAEALCSASVMEAQ